MMMIRTLMLSLLLSVVVAWLCGCVVMPANIGSTGTYPAGDGLLQTTNRTPVDVRVVVP